MYVCIGHHLCCSACAALMRTAGGSGWVHSWSTVITDIFSFAYTDMNYAREDPANASHSSLVGPSVGVGGDYRSKSVSPLLGCSMRDRRGVGNLNISVGAATTTTTTTTTTPPLSRSTSMQNNNNNDLFIPPHTLSGMSSSNQSSVQSTPTNDRSFDFNDDSIDMVKPRRKQRLSASGMAAAAFLQRQQELHEPVQAASLGGHSLSPQPQSQSQTQFQRPRRSSRLSKQEMQAVSSLPPPPVMSIAALPPPSALFGVVRLSLIVTVCFGIWGIGH